MLQQLFPLVGHEVDHHVGRKRKHPIAGEQAEDRGEGEADRRQGEKALDRKDGVQVWQVDWMLRDGGQSLAVDFLVPRQFRIERKTVTEQGANCQLFHQRLPRMPVYRGSRLFQEPTL